MSHLNSKREGEIAETYVPVRKCEELELGAQADTYLCSVQLDLDSGAPGLVSDHFCLRDRVTLSTLSSPGIFDILHTCMHDDPMHRRRWSIFSAFWWLSVFAGVMCTPRPVLCTLGTASLCTWSGTMKRLGGRYLWGGI